MRKPLMILVGALVAATFGAVGPAAAADPAWNGQYSLKRFAASKTGTSLAARQQEPDFADVYTFVTNCAVAPCTATVVGGPAPANPTLPQPPVYRWESGSWVHRYDWQWDCYQGAGVPKVWRPAHSVAYYTPQANGTLRGVWTTTIDGGPCHGTVIMDVTATPVGSVTSPGWTLS
ncbi:hypothetical protein [Gordonia soli]|uniref:Secreted protein n=1 Tax=Gordonia soli NBRC 108243 TaxID=1223545 RepID=M0QQD6_9ACTN|nr:hypothetical protein [Gordonia soli]GAC70614.1 hypothetical protein GS4_38_00190 [Gordonia soli NBRC 108243]